MADAHRLHDYLDTAKEAARRGALVLQKWRNRFQVRDKGDRDPVTEADVESQRTIQEFIAARHPDHAFLGEEDNPGSARGKADPRPTPDAPPTWICDPLDGTTNYVHDCPLYCVSIGLQVSGELVVGVILDPSRDEMFAAAQGQGAWLNGRPIQTSKVGALKEALLATGFPPDLRGQEVALDWWRHFSFRAHSLRRTGTTALNLAYVACGRFDGYWAFDNHVWDVAAGVVLVREAGGLVSNADGSKYDPYTPDAVAGNAALHAVLVECLRGKPGD